MARAFIIVIDSLGCGGAPDAADFGDEGADTLGHVAAACAAGLADARGRKGPLHAPVLDSLGLARAARISTGESLPGLNGVMRAGASAGCACETSRGKDTPSGHWEMAGAPLEGWPGQFPQRIPAFPEQFISDVVTASGIAGVIGQCHSAGVEIIDKLGAEHVSTGKPIFYTSVDSVIQIAAHEEAFGLERLYDLCKTTRRLADPLNIGRVIARPFVGSATSGFQRTPRRKDFSMPPPHGNILDRAVADNRSVVTLGKCGDIFGHRSTGEEITGAHDLDLFGKMLSAAPRLSDGGLLFANFVDLDTDFGHRRNVAGYAAGIEHLDPLIGAFLDLMQVGDLCVVTADHGNDPTWRGTDHTRENVPVLAYEPGGPVREIGRRSTFADIGASVARHLGLEPPICGKPWN
ncbi:MAG: phosphopentomutase [Beijerinckiaceae bacterium]|nr:phosphopentomutase [Beijerinckiaceae bacterium]